MSSNGTPAAGETIGQRLKRLRLDRGLSQRELAAPGVSYAYISRIEAGSRQPSVKALRRLAAKLGVSADYLETGSDLDPDGERELKLSDLELAVRLGDAGAAEEGLRELITEAERAGDRHSARRAQVALAAIMESRGAYGEAARLLEDAIRDEPFDPVVGIDSYAQLAQVYSASGKARRAVELLERCLDELEEGEDAVLEARYSVLLSYALSDAGDLVRAEEVVERALERAQESEDPYMRVRLYWSLARLASAEGRSSVALENARKAIALLQVTDDTLHLARAHVLAANIALKRDDAEAASRHLDEAERLLGRAPAAEDLIELKHCRSRVAALRGDAREAVELARETISLIGHESPADEGRAHAALGDALALVDDVAGADAAYSRAADLLEQQGRWRDATATCRAWARMLRQVGREDQAMDVLDRAAELAMRAAPAEARAER
ncbi:MAG TPA: helix-turn-helix domain-containing protein [Gaiellaceae bacterium]|nr:helix-turn-helix domain-containing protein [Gaiellaceae bacterium]